MKKILTVLMMLLVLLVINVGCGSSGGSGDDNKDGYTLKYNGNGNTYGSVPADGNVYSTGEVITIIGNKGNLEKDGYNFIGWNTKSNGDGETYVAGDTFQIEKDIILYAKWEEKLYDNINWEDVLKLEEIDGGYKIVRYFEPFEPDEFGEYDESQKMDIVIPETINGKKVLVIGNNAFENTHTVSVVIPDSVTVIENNAFFYCELKSVTIGKSVTSIGDNAFMGNKLTSVVIPDSVTIIEDGAFENNPLEEIIGKKGSAAEQYAIENGIKFVKTGN